METCQEGKDTGRKGEHDNVPHDHMENYAEEMW